MCVQFWERRSLPDTFVDNDVVLKLCRFGRLADLAGCLEQRGSDLRVLGSLRFKIWPMVASDAGMNAALTAFLGEVSEVEPSDADILLAAQIEEAAQRMGHAVDDGESILFAMAIAQAAQVATGDKRAVQGLAAIAGDVPACMALSGTILTMEWLASTLVLRHGVDTIRDAVCATPKVDRAMEICFQCSRDSCTSDDICAALASYQRDLARQTKGFVTADLPTAVGA